MRWDLAQSTDQFQYWKLDQEELTAELKFNKPAQSFRLTAGEKRLFFIEKVGFLQHKFLIRTEYSVITGEIYPVKNTHSGIAVLDNKKYHYSLQDSLLMLSSKKENVSLAIEIENATGLNAPELCALVFGTLRVASKYFTKVPALA